MKKKIVEQARLMLKVLQHVAPETCFGLKGGTAINFFVRDMPRLSVDIDLTYLPVKPRLDSLNEIGEALTRIKDGILRTMRGSTVEEKKTEGTLVKLMVAGAGGRIKLEPNLILRGSVYGAGKRHLSPKSEKEFQTALEMNVLSLPDLYGGKICAALDRQHPRDLYDVKLLLANEGLTPEIRKAFVVYWVSHSRPMHEIINPTRLDMRNTFEEQFEGMTTDAVTYEELLEAREELIRSLLRDLSDEERRFAVSIKSGRPDWGLLGIDGIDKLPGIQWKLTNIKRMPIDKHREQLDKLKRTLGL
jgi:predicted nucleotidyltransferase component of viral defense system